MKTHCSISKLTRVGVLFGLGISAGCSAVAMTPVGDRTVVARTSIAFETCISAYSRGESAHVDLNGKACDVTPQRVTWDQNHWIELPAGWKRLELDQSGKCVNVRADGKELCYFDPAA